MGKDTQKNKKGLMQKYKDWVEENRDSALLKYIAPAGFAAYSAMNIINGHAAYDFNKDVTYANKRNKEKRLKELMSKHQGKGIDFNDHISLDEIYWKKLMEGADDAEDFREARDIVQFLEEYPVRRFERALGLTLMGAGIGGVGAGLGIMGVNLYKDISKKSVRKKRN